MTDDTPTNSFFSMVTGKPDQRMPLEETKAHSPGLNEPDSSVSMDNTGELTSATAETVHSAADADSADSDMPHQARRVLVHLMRQGTILASQKARLFEQLCQYESAIRRHLSEVYLQLVLDQKSGVAFVASITSEYADQSDQDDMDLESEDVATLISKRTLSLFDTLILLVLRKHYQEREVAGEQKITIDIDRLESLLTPFLPITDHASKDRKKLLARVKEMVRRKVLSAIRGEEERYEITPIIRYVVNASFLETLLEEYTALAAEQMGETDRAGDDH